MKYSNMIDLLEDVEKHFFTNGANVDISTAKIYGGVEYYNVFLKGELGYGRMLVISTDEQSSFEWDGFIDYRPTNLKWAKLNDSWMRINVFSNIWD